jgi:hypothetical protein
MGERLTEEQFAAALDRADACKPQMLAREAERARASEAELAKGLRWAVAMLDVMADHCHPDAREDYEMALESIRAALAQAGGTP